MHVYLKLAEIQVVGRATNNGEHLSPSKEIMIKFDHFPQFITITNHQWLPVLQKDYHKDIIIESLQKRIQKNELTLYGYVIMPNHMHMIWQLHDGIVKQDFQRDFLKFTSRSILSFMRMNNDSLINQLEVSSKDRKHQVWKRNSLGIDIFSEKTFVQKLGYIHRNPVKEKWNLVQLPEQYKYSSANFYETGIDPFGIVSHYKG